MQTAFSMKWCLIGPTSNMKNSSKRHPLTLMGGTRWLSRDLGLGWWNWARKAWGACRTLKRYHRIWNWTCRKSRWKRWRCSKFRNTTTKKMIAAIWYLSKSRRSQVVAGRTPSSRSRHPTGKVASSTNTPTSWSTFRQKLYRTVLYMTSSDNWRMRRRHYTFLKQLASDHQGRTRTWTCQNIWARRRRPGRPSTTRIAWTLLGIIICVTTSTATVK